MDTVLPIAFTVAGLAWVAFMLGAMFGILKLAPKGQKMRTYNQLSMWKFGEIRADLGTAVEPHLRTMRRGAYAFLIVFAGVVLVSIVSIVVTSMRAGTP